MRKLQLMYNSVYIYIVKSLVIGLNYVANNHIVMLQQIPEQMPSKLIFFRQNRGKSIHRSWEELKYL